MLSRCFSTGERCAVDCFVAGGARCEGCGLTILASGSKTARVCLGVLWDFTWLFLLLSKYSAVLKFWYVLSWPMSDGTECATVSACDCSVVHRLR
jgi:hypothetical protein